MRFLLAILFIITMTADICAQDGPRITRHRLYDHSQDDSTDYRRRLTMDVDSTGLTLSAWGDECGMRINLLERMAINATVYIRGRRGGVSYVEYGNDNYRLRMYESPSGGFEFDFILLKPPPNGRYMFPFDIQTWGVRFEYQRQLTQREIAMGDVRPDNIVGSYAVYKTSDNIVSVIDGVKTFGFGGAKVTHIKRPKAWTAVGDTTWGVIEIIDEINRMRIGVDSTWLANVDRANYPVTIDPNFGVEDVGASGMSAGMLFLGYKVTTGSDAAGASFDSVAFHVNSRDAGGCDGVGGCSFIWGLYSHDAGNDEPDALLSAQSSGGATTGTGWDALNTGFAVYNLGASTIYWLCALSDHDSQPEIKFSFDHQTDLEVRFARSDTYDNTDYPTLPANFGTLLLDDDRTVSVYGSYTVSGGDEPIRRRRRRIH